MGSYSIKVNEWSNQLIKNILSEDRYIKLKDDVSYHEHFETYSSFGRNFVNKRRGIHLQELSVIQILAFLNYQIMVGILIKMR